MSRIVIISLNKTNDFDSLDYAYIHNYQHGLNLHKYCPSLHNIPPRPTTIPIPPYILLTMPRRHNTVPIRNNNSHDPKYTPYSIKHGAYYLTSIRCLRSSPRSFPTRYSIKLLRNRLRTKPQSPTMLKIIIPTTILIPLVWLSKHSII